MRCEVRAGVQELKVEIHHREREGPCCAGELSKIRLMFVFLKACLMVARGKV